MVRLRSLLICICCTPTTPKCEFNRDGLAISVKENPYFVIQRILAVHIYRGDPEAEGGQAVLRSDFIRTNMCSWRSICSGLKAEFRQI